MRSTASSSRARANSQRGFALVAAIALAILYFALIELLLMDSSRQLAEARRFRARVVAETLAENAVERAALQIVSQSHANISNEDEQGKISGTLLKAMEGDPSMGIPFVLTGDSETAGVVRTKAHVELRGVVLGNQVKIQYAVHTP